MSQVSVYEPYTLIGTRQRGMVFLCSIIICQIKKKCDIPADVAAFYYFMVCIIMHPHIYIYIYIYIYKEYILCYPKLILLVYWPDGHKLTPRNV